jgi:hypothetical protein
MAVKIFCNACQNFIRDARIHEIPELRGTEVCTTCEGKAKSAFDALDKISKRAAKRIHDTASKAKADMEEAVRRVIMTEEE